MDNHNVVSRSLTIRVSEKCVLQDVHYFIESNNDTVKFLPESILEDVLKEASFMGIEEINLEGDDVFSLNEIIHIIEEYSPKFNYFYINVPFLTFDSEVLETMALHTNVIVRINTGKTEDDLYRMWNNINTFKKVITSIKSLTDKKIKVIIDFVLSRDNHCNFEKLLRIMYDLGVSGVEYSFLSEDGRRNIPVKNMDIIRLCQRYETSRFYIRGNEDFCRKFNKLEVDANGKVLYDSGLREKIIMGNVLDKSLLDIMDSYESRMFAIYEENICE